MTLPSVNIKGSIFEEYVTAEQIRDCVRSVAAQINKDYQGKSTNSIDAAVLFIGVLNGAAPFLADLVRELTIDCELDFIRVSSYNGLESSGEVKITLNMKSNIQGRHVIVVEDIIETGLSLFQLESTLRKLEPESLQLCAFCRKPACVKYDVKPKYLGMDLAPQFLVGYGLDYDEKGRQYSSIYRKVKPTAEH